MVKLSSIEGGKPPEAEVVTYLKGLLDRAEKGDVVEYVAVVVDKAGGIETSYYLTKKTTEMAMRAFVDFDEIAAHIAEPIGGPG